MRIRRIRLSNIKGIINGDIDLSKYSDNIPNIIGIFGPNGTGKTSVLEVLASLKSLITGNKLNSSLVGSRCGFSEIELELIDRNSLYLFRVKFTVNMIIEESLIVDNFIVYSLNADNIIYPDIFRDKGIIESLFRNNDLDSVFFNKTYYEVLKSGLSIPDKVDSFINFFYNLVYLPANYVYNESAPIKIGSKIINILTRVHLTESEYNYLYSVYDRINIVLKKITDRKLIIKNRGIINDSLVEYQTMVNYRNTLIDISEESLGIKRLILYLIYLVPLIHNPNSCVCIDEVDSGIFELLLKELLLAVNNGRAGQFIFTAYNFEAINVLQSGSVIIATLDDDNKFITFNNYHVLDTYLDHIRNDNSGHYYKYVDTYTLRKLLKENDI